MTEGYFCMNIQESAEMYLETILVLSEGDAPVRSLDIANHMNYSKPSVSRAVKLLKEGDYIIVDGNGHITLTPSGQEIAQKIFERHNVLSSLFERLGVSKETAIEDACRIEHVISDETFNAIKAHMTANN